MDFLYLQAYTVLQSSLQSTLQAGKIHSTATDSDALRQAFLVYLLYILFS